jgi:hypothetical protein
MTVESVTITKINRRIERMIANIDKIKNVVNPHVINTINELTNSGDVATLKQWLSDCTKEIEQRKSAGMSWNEYIYPLINEEKYLMVCLGE